MNRDYHPDTRLLLVCILGIVLCTATCYGLPLLLATLAVLK